MNQLSEAINNTELFQILEQKNNRNCQLLELQLPAVMDSFEALTHEFDQFAEQASWNPIIVNQLLLVIEELIINIINHGYTDRPHGTIDFRLMSDAKTIVIYIEDDGDPFNPFTKEDPDLTLAIEDRPIGGLGIFLIRQTMDQYHYRFSHGHNQIILLKEQPV